MKQQAQSLGAFLVRDVFVQVTLAVAGEIGPLHHYALDG